MRLSRFFLMMIVFTTLSLVYIQLQVQIFDLGYKSESKKIEAQRLKDHNTDIAYNIYKLKSASNLGVKLLSDDSKMRFLDNRHIIKLETPAELLGGSEPAKTDISKLSKRPNLLASIFSLKSQAEAEPIQ